MWYSRTGHRWQTRSRRIACWIPEATHTHSVHVILIDFPMQQWLHERASILRWYVCCLSCFSVTDGAVVSCNLALSPNATYGHHWARNRQKYVMTIKCRHNMSNTTVSQTKTIYLRREVLCKTWRKYSLCKFQGVCEPKVCCWIRAGSCTFWEAVFQFRIILWCGLVKRSFFS